MKIIVSPAKKMRSEVDGVDARSIPVFLEQSRQLAAHLKTLSLEELRRLLGCNDALARLNYERYQRMDLDQKGEPALLSYEGIQYQYMAPSVFEDAQFAYAQEHLRILSGLYGVLKPLDGIVPYRLEMQARLRTDFCTSLYDFWGPLLYEELTKDENVILNLASAEYSRCISRYVEVPIRMVDVIFAEQQPDGALREKGVYVKMARGEMVRYLCENQVSDVEEIRQFDRMRYHFDPSRSDAHRYVFVR